MIDTTEQLADAYLWHRRIFPWASIGFSWWAPLDQHRAKVVLLRDGTPIKHGWMDVGYCAYPGRGE